MNKKQLVFSTLFKKYRLRSEIETLAEFADLLASEGMSYAISLFTRWQNGQRVPTDRRALLAMIKIFVRRGGINSVDEANELLECLDMRDLKGDEIEAIQAAVVIDKGIDDVRTTFISINLYRAIYRKIIEEYESVLIISIFIFLTIYWLYSGEKHFLGDFASIYFVIALLGSLNGFVMAKKMDCLNSSIGKSILMFSLGLLSQVFGQLVYSYYYYNNYMIAYPSWGDIGFFGTIPLYIMGVLYLSKFLGVRINLRSYMYELGALIVPLAMLCLSYIHLLGDYHFSENNFLRIILDFGYPFGQTVYISIAFLALLLSKQIFGSMKRKLRLIIIALVCQYIADYVFIYLAHEGKISPGGISDYIYMMAYLLISIAIIQFKNIRAA